MTKLISCAIVQKETKRNYFTERNSIMKRAQRVAEGESMKRTNKDFLALLHVHITVRSQQKKRIRFNGDVRNVTGKSPTRNCRARDSASKSMSKMYLMALHPYANI